MYASQAVLEPSSHNVEDPANVEAAAENTSDSPTASASSDALTSAPNTQTQKSEKREKGLRTKFEDFGLESSEKELGEENTLNRDYERSLGAKAAEDGGFL